MKLESTHDVEQREQEQHELSTMSYRSLIFALADVLKELAEMPRWAFGSNRHVCLLRRRSLVRAELENRDADDETRWSYLAFLHESEKN